MNYWKHISSLISVLFFVALLACTKKKESGPEGNPAPGPVWNGPTQNLQWLALGDSYTIGTSVTAEERYVSQSLPLLRTAGLQFKTPQIIAVNGWTTSDLLEAMKPIPSSSQFDLVTILIGVNNQFRGRSLEEYEQQFQEILERGIQLAKNDKKRVIVLSIPDYGVTPVGAGYNAERVAREIDLFNQVNRNLANRFQVAYLNVTDLSRKAKNDPSLVASDGLHFSGKAYKEWAELLSPLILTAFK